MKNCSLKQLLWTKNRSITLVECQMLKRKKCCRQCKAAYELSTLSLKKLTKLKNKSTTTKSFFPCNPHDRKKLYKLTRNINTTKVKQINKKNNCWKKNKKKFQCEIFYTTNFVRTPYFRRLRHLKVCNLPSLFQTILQFRL